MEGHQALNHCPLCQAPQDRVGFVPLEHYAKDHLVRCGGCGFNFSILIPSEADYARVYGAYDYAQEDASRSDINIQHERSIVERLMPYKSTGQVLDIAAGAGRFLERFAEVGFDCSATEFNTEMCDYLRRKGFTAYEGGLFPQGAPVEAFDIVIFTEIIEHINDPMSVLANIFRLLRSGGCLYITTPNFNSLERRIIGASWGMLCWPEHITYWTPKHLDSALVGSGFRKASLQTRNISPFRIVEALKRGRLSSALSDVSPQQFSDAAQRAVGGNNLLSACKAAVNFGLNATGLGSSMEAVYVKQG